VVTAMLSDNCMIMYAAKQLVILACVHDYPCLWKLHVSIRSI